MRHFPHAFQFFHKFSQQNFHGYINSKLQLHFLYHSSIKAYIPMQRKTTHVGVLRWSRPQTQQFRITYSNMLVSKKPRGPNPKPHGPNTSPNTIQCNILCVWYARVWFALAMYILNCLCQFRLRWVPDANPASVEYGLTSFAIN